MIFKPCKSTKRFIRFFFIIKKILHSPPLLAHTFYVLHLFYNNKLFFTFIRHMFEWKDSIYEGCDKMKIAIFTDTFLPDVNGVAKTLGRLTRYLDKTNHSYIVISPKRSRKEQGTKQIYLQSSFPFPLYPDCRISVPNKNEIKELLHSFNPDIIHVATAFSIGLCGIRYAKKFDIPLVGSYHTDFDHYLQYYHLPLLSKPLWRYMEWFHQSMARIFVPSTYTFEQLNKRNFSNIQVWERGVDSSIFHPNYSKDQIRQKYNISKKIYTQLCRATCTRKKIWRLYAILLIICQQKSMTKSIG